MTPAAPAADGPAPAAPAPSPRARRPRAGGLAYRVVRGLARRLLALEYRAVEVEGAAHVPTDGPVLLVANHQNALVDSLALLVATPRPAGPLAKAPLFRVPLLAPFLRGTGAVPVYRPQDTAANDGRGARANLDVLAACAARLAAGEALVLFPEGVSHAGPRLLPLRTGAARIALDAGRPVAVVPVALVFEPAGRRRGRALVRFGPPVVVDGAAAPGAARRAAVAATTRRVEAALRGVLAEADTHADLEAIRGLEAVLATARGDDAAGPLAARHAGRLRLARALPALRQVDPAGLDALRAATLAHLRLLDALGLPPEHADAAFPPGRVLRFVATNLVRAVLLGPLLLVAAVVTAPARAVGALLALRRAPVAEDVVPLHRILGLALATLGWALLLGLGAGLASSPPGGRGLLVGAGVVALVPLLLALHGVGRDARADVAARTRAFFLLAGGRLRDDLRAQRAALVAAVDAAAVRLRDAGVDLGAPDLS